MTDKIRVRVKSSYFGYNGERYTQSDELNVHPGALEKHPNTLERVSNDTSSEPEPVPNDDEDHTCIGNDGDCSRSVDGPNTTCWQHS